MNNKLKTLSETGKQNLYSHQVRTLSNQIEFLTIALAEAQEGLYTEPRSIAHFLTPQNDLQGALNDINDLAVEWFENKSKTYTGDIDNGARRRGQRRTNLNQPYPATNQRRTVGTDRRNNCDHMGV